MEVWTDRIAAISLPGALLVLTALTAARIVLRATRAAVFRLLAELIESAILAFALVFLLLRPFLIQTYYIPTGSMHPTLREGDHILVNKWIYRWRAPQRGDVLVFRAPPEAAPDEKEFIKRIVGLPGDCVAVKEGFVQVGGQIFTRTEIRAILGEPQSADERAEQAPRTALRLTRDALWFGGRHVLPDEFAALAGHPGEPVTIHPGLVLRNGEPLVEGYIAEDAQYHMEPCVIPPGHLFVMGDNRNQSHDSHFWGPLSKERVVGRAEFVFWPLAHAQRIE